MRSRAALVALPVFAIAAIGAFLATRGGGAGPASARGKVAFDRLEYDFGAVRQEADLSTRFTARNEGGAPLHLSVGGDCGCTQPTLSAEVVAPGGSATVDVVFHTHTFVGRIVKYLHVKSDDPDKPVTDLALRLDVAAGIVAQPPHFFFNQVLVGSSPTAEVTLKWREGTGKPFHVLGVETTAQVPGSLPPDVAFETKPFDEAPWHGYRLTMRFPTPPPLGMVSGTALIRTDDPDTPKVQALIGGNVSGRVNITMRAPSFGVVPEGKGTTLPIQVFPFDATVDLGVVTAKARKGSVEAEAKRLPYTRGAWVVEIRLPPSAAPGAIDDVVEVHTAVPGEETVEIKVSGVVTPKGP